MAEDKKETKAPAKKTAAKKPAAKKTEAKAPAKKAAPKKEAPKATAKKQLSGKTVTVEQIGSPIGRSTLEDTPSVRGMINKVSHLVKVIDEAA